MIIKNVPFFKNIDDTHCYQAVFKMILKYFLPEKDFSWSYLDKMTGKQKNMWTWPIRAWINLRKLGFEVIEKDNFDYNRFIKEGIKYIKEEFGDEIAHEQAKHSDIAKAIEDAKKYIKLSDYQPTLPKIQDVLDLLDKGYLVVCGVDAKTLNGRKKYEGHVILIYGYEGDNLFVHDPGPPAFKAKVLPIELFKKAWEYPNERARNLEAYKLS